MARFTTNLTLSAGSYVSNTTLGETASIAGMRTRGNSLAKLVAGDDAVLDGDQHATIKNDAFVYDLTVNGVTRLRFEGFQTFNLGEGNDVLDLTVRPSNAVNAWKTGVIANGGAGNDVIWGGEGADLIRGDGGNDRLWAGAGPDADEETSDRVNGGADADRIYGSQGNDILNGDGGDDLIFCDADGDRLTGGTGVDRYIWRPGDGNSSVFGFTTGPDLLLIESSDVQFIADREAVGSPSTFVLVGADQIFTIFGKAANTFGFLDTQTLDGVTYNVYG